MEGVRLVARSSVYETEPVGEITDQRDFLNAALSVDTDLEPLELLAGCKSIEHELGRIAGPRHGPRAIDVDLLLVGDLVLESDRLRLPHPELRSRRFVLVPVLELEPGLRLPDGASLQDCLISLPPGQRVSRVASLEPVPG
jgi:2-amino-4-hydroxy-6-hydroxymethyldihydropteridine diphosphokinase